METTVEKLGDYTIIQTRKGYRFTVDSVILSDFILPLNAHDTVCDIGTGSCIIPLLIVQKTAVHKIAAIEIQHQLADIAKQNIMANHLEKKIDLIKIDYREAKGIYRRETFDLVFSNPPYFREGSGRKSSNKERATSKMEIAGSLSELICISAYLVKKAGRICYIYPVSRFNDMLSGISKAGLNIKRLSFVHANKGKDAHLFMVEASHSKGNLRVEKPVILDRLQQSNDTL